LQREKRSTRIDEIQARQAILQRDLLRSQVLLYRDRVIGAALHRRIVRDNDHVAPRHAADGRDDAGARRLVVVQPVARERRQFEKRRTRVDEARNALAYRQLALLSMPLYVLRAAALPGNADSLPQFGDEPRHALEIDLERRAVLVNQRVEFVHAIGLPALPPSRRAGTARRFLPVRRAA